MKNNNNKGFSLSSFTVVVLTIVFVVLKLCGVIAWSWWWVLSPLWISTCLALVLLAIGILCAWIGNKE